MGILQFAQRLRDDVPQCRENVQVAIAFGFIHVYFGIGNTLLVGFRVGDLQFRLVALYA